MRSRKKRKWPGKTHVRKMRKKKSVETLFKWTKNKKTRGKKKLGKKCENHKNEKKKIKPWKTETKI